MVIHVVASRYEALDPLDGVKNEALECHPLGGVEIFFNYQCSKKCQKMINYVKVLKYCILHKLICQIMMDEGLGIFL